MRSIFKLQAREILRAAKRNGIKMETWDFNYCAIGVVGHAIGYKYRDHTNNWSDGSYKDIVAERIGHDPRDLEALEAGFENRMFKNVYKNNRYLKVGEKLRTLAGVS